MSIFVNQVGYTTSGKKHATVNTTGKVCLMNSAGEAVLEKTIEKLRDDINSGESVAVVDFSEFTTPGTYYLKDSTGVESCKFEINDKIYNKLFIDSLKMFYFQRCGIELEEKYAGKFTHKACHTAKVSLLKDPSKVFSCCGGWHDAGDYGRYVTAGAVAAAHLLYAFEFNPDVFKDSLNIPESGNNIPDVLNEVKWELDWMLQMMDDEGGVYHKCTSIHHTSFVMPEDDPLPFIVTPVSSIATADFAALMALAARIYKEYDSEYSKTLEAAANKAAEWLKAHPEYVFKNPSECTTGTYEDPIDLDERLWADVELYRLTKSDYYLNRIFYAFNTAISTTALGWGDVGGLAALGVFGDMDAFPFNVTERFKKNWISEADRLLAVISENDFELAFNSFNFCWGSNLGVLSNACILCFAHKLTNDAKYLDAANYQIDYILGRNALDTSYVTGYGDKAFRNPHNRPTQADGIDEPIPGYVSGGPNGRPGDPAAIEAIKKGTAPMKCFIDDWMSYSTNEITIYWNSPLVLALSYILGIN